MSTENKQAFTVTDIDSASWAMRKLAKKRSEKAALEAHAERERKRIDAWLDSETESLNGEISYFEWLLIDYYRCLREDDPKAKVTTPWGKVASRKTSKVTYKDEEAFMAWAEANGEGSFIKEKVSKSIDKMAVKKACQVVDGQLVSPTGQALPDVTFSESVSYTVQTEDEGHE